MTTVRIVDGLKYGFKLLGIFIAVTLVCGAFIAGGAYIYRDARAMVNPTQMEYYGQIAASGLIVLVGALGLVGSTIALSHKFIADSVIAGIETADPESGTIETGTPGESGGSDRTGGPESTDGNDAGSTEQESASADKGESETSEEDEDDTQGEGIFGIDTSKTKAQPSEPRTRQPLDETQPVADEPAADERPSAVEPDAARQPTATDQRSWQQEPDEPSVNLRDQVERDEHGYPKSVATNPPRDESSEAETSDPAQSDDASAEAANADFDDSEPSEDDDGLWDGESGRKNIDQVVSEATAPDDESVDSFEDASTPDPADETSDTSFDDATASDEGGTLKQEPDDEPQTIDDAPGEFVAKPPVDETRSDDADSETETEDDTDPADKLPTEPYDDIEDTTDEEGDWEPLDESDL